MVVMNTGNPLSPSGYKEQKLESNMQERVGFETDELLNKEFRSLLFNYLREKSNVYLYGLDSLVKCLVGKVKEDRSETTFKIAKLAKICPRSMYYYLDGGRPIPIKDFFVLVDLAKLDLLAIIDLLQLPFLKMSCGSGSRNRLIKIPLRVSPDLLYITGYLFGDGCLHSKKWSISFVDEYLEQISKVDKIFSTVFSANGTIIEYQGKAELRIYSKALILLFSGVFEMPRGKKKKTLHLPKIWQKLPRAHKLAFLQGLFDADAGLCRIEEYKEIPNWVLKKPNIEFVQSNEEFVCQIKLLCEYFDMGAVGPYFNKRNGGYRLMINGKERLKKCKSLPLFRHPIKKRRLSALIDILE